MWRTTNTPGSPILAVGDALMVDAEQPDEVRPAALAEFQVVGVIDDAGEIGVLEIDADRQHMRLALDPPGKIRPLALVIRRRR